MRSGLEPAAKIRLTGASAAIAAARTSGLIEYHPSFRRGQNPTLHPELSRASAERQLTYLARELGRLEWQVHVAPVRRGPNWTRLEESGAIIHELPFGRGDDHG